VGGVAALGKGLPFPADCALPTMLVARLSVTELSTWPTRDEELRFVAWERCLLDDVFALQPSETF